MPTYEYRCKACGAEHEVFQSMKEAPKRKCPACGKLALERQIGTGAGFIFKGAGFYLTDYRSDSYKQGEKADRSGGDATASAPAEGSQSSDAPAPKKDAAKASKGGRKSKSEG